MPTRSDTTLMRKLLASHGRIIALELGIVAASLVFAGWGGVASAWEAAKATPAASASLEMTPCTLPDVHRPVRCGSLRVPENPDAPGGRPLSIGVAVVPATEKGKHEDPIVLLMGGPGESAISAASGFVDQFATLLRERDLLLVDQRGTGRSGALRCDLASEPDPRSRLNDFFPPATVASCEQRLSKTADLTQYTYPRFADDLEQVRRTLGYGALNLFAGSYGTRAAQVYMRAYPHSVRTAYIGSAVPVDVASPLSMARTAQGGLDHLFGDCAADASCAAAFPHLKDETREVFARLASGAVRVAMPGESGTWPLKQGRVGEWLRTSLYRPTSAAAVPWKLHRAYLGDWAPIVKDITAVDDDADFSFGLLFAITCSEDVPFIQASEIEPEVRGTFLGDDRVRQQQAACRYWPRASLPAGYRTPVQSSVPTLFVTGDRDGGTPLWFTQRVMAGFPNAVEIVVKGQGHTDWNPCVAGLYDQLVQSGSVSGFRKATCPPVPLPPFKTS